MEIEDIIPVKKYQHSENQVKPFIQDLLRLTNDIATPLSEKEIDSIVKVLSSKYRIRPPKPQMRSIYEQYFPDISIKNELKRYFIKRVMRSESGVLVVTIVTKPGDTIKFSCPEKCAYCPTETDRDGKPTQPKSYISTEPAMLRATRSNFDIEQQIRDRIKAYVFTGNLKKDQKKKKIEVILSGGTWDVMPKQYRDQVINEIYYSFNTFSDVSNKGKRPMLSIEEEKKINESTLLGVIGLTIETRPDYVTNKALLEYLEYGVTRVQLGGQSTHDDILTLIKRGCTKKNMITAIRKLKGIGMKVVTHWMPDLPGSSPQKDTEMFDELIASPDLQSDDWKVYPCAVVKSSSDDLIIKSEINEWYENGTYIPYSETNINDLINVCIAFKKKVNPWVRIERLVRDIPTQSIEAGYSKFTNLRQMIHDRAPNCCKCIRCMEIKDRGHLMQDGKLVVREYKASYGIEYHISFEVEKTYWNMGYILFCILYFWNRLFGKTIYYKGNRELYNGVFGFLRLRIDPNPGLGIVNELVGCGLIREVHVYGMSTSVGNMNVISSQHKGIGQLLMKTAENIIKQNGLKKAAVIAGIGAREYYKNKCGYHCDTYYMIKQII
jgi:ELP3 family radical SAM enzyme/protein acetyltransferase